ncbi:hypothetical protein [Aureibacillus halotolerans]|uniref:Uncharacterized protein n=1 Tax=Aureibacillus halotolerans TaxID=1508390 RepID=A0A4R6TUM9_9BACI|nr:hypothetical protein [Aureibacillus halotolerans]TDQ37448.1 hypothetical protein EV213_11383 [Aureibacillus halotolerans]
MNQPINTFAFGSACCLIVSFLLAMRAILYLETDTLLSVCLFTLAAVQFWLGRALFLYDRNNESKRNNMNKKDLSTS